MELSTLTPSHRRRTIHQIKAWYGARINILFCRCQELSRGALAHKSSLQDLHLSYGSLELLQMGHRTADG